MNKYTYQNLKNTAKLKKDEIVIYLGCDILGGNKFQMEFPFRNCMTCHLKNI